MTHTKRSDWPQNNFIKLASGLDVQPLLDLIDAQPDLWREIEARQNSMNSPHRDTECIFARGPYKMTRFHVQFDLGAYDYPCMEYLKPGLMPVMSPILRGLEVDELGRVLIVKLKPGGHVSAHDDQGTYADHFARFHIVLSSNPGCTQSCGGQEQAFEVGDAWWFDHKKVHTADNTGDTDRVHIIFDATSPFFPMPGVPVSTQENDKVVESGVVHE